MGGSTRREVRSRIENLSTFGVHHFAIDVGLVGRRVQGCKEVARVDDDSNANLTEAERTHDIVMGLESYINVTSRTQKVSYRLMQREMHVFTRCNGSRE